MAGAQVLDAHPDDSGAWVTDAETQTAPRTRSGRGETVAGTQRPELSVIL